MLPASGLGQDLVCADIEFWRHSNLELVKLCVASLGLNMLYLDQSGCSTSCTNYIRTLYEAPLLGRTTG